MVRWFVVVALLSFRAYAQQPAAPDAAGGPTPAQFAETAKKLAAPADARGGDVLALKVCQLFLAVKGQFDAPTMCSYSTKENVVEVGIWGTRDRVEGARETLENARALVVAAAARFGPIGPENLRIIYLYAPRGILSKDAPREILRLDGGKFITP